MGAFKFSKAELVASYDANSEEMIRATVTVITDLINKEFEGWLKTAGDVMEIALPQDGWEVLLVTSYTEAEPRVIRLDSKVAQTAMERVIVLLTEEGFHTKFADNKLSVSLNEFPADEEEPETESVDVIYRTTAHTHELKATVTYLKDASDDEIRQLIEEKYAELEKFASKAPIG